MKKENRCATCEELCRYIKEEVKPGDTVRLSLGRVYIPGKVVTNNSGVIQIKIDSDLIKVLQPSMLKTKDYLIELEHECEGGVCIIEAVDE